MPGRRLGQHFLRNHVVAEKIAGALRPAAGDVIVEIGPGRGFLTAHLLRKPGRHLAVELDEKLVAELRSRFAGEAWSVEHADFLQWSPGPELAGTPLKFVGNLPYNASAPILQRLLSWPGWRLAIVMLQKEVAERVMAEPGTKEFGLLSLSVQLRAYAERVCDVPPACFWPPPKVDSTVVRLTPLPPDRAVLPPDLDEAWFFKVAHAAFSQRRKVVVNPLSAGLALSKEEVRSALASAGLDPLLRAEDIDAAGYVRLARSLRSPSRPS